MVSELAERLFVLDDPETLQKETVERAVRILHCTSGMMCLLGEDSRHVTRGPSVGRAKELRLADLFAAAPVLQVVFNERRPLVLVDPELTIGPSLRGWPAIAIAPMMGAERMIGTLLVGEHLDGERFTEFDEAVLGIIASLAGGALEIRQAFTRFRDQMAREITEATSELTRFAAELQRVKTFNQELFQSAPVGIIVFDRESRVTFRNGAAERLWPQDRSVLEAGRRTDLATRDPDWEAALRDVVNMQRLWRAEDVSFAKPGRDPVRVNLTCSPLVTTGHTVAGGVLIVEDVTQRAQMERRLAASERLASIGRLASNVAHELNNPLDGITRLVNLARRSAEEEKNERLQKYLAEANKGLLRMAVIVRDLLDYSRTATRSTEPMAVKDILAEVAGSVASAADKARVRVQVLCSPELPPLKSGALYQVVLNLLKNAVEAMPGGGEVQVQARCETGALVVEVADTGPGISADSLPRIFEPFYSTKPQGQGTGLGLAISKDLVEKQGGTIAACNRPGGGALFTVCIPLAPLGD